ncbi:hypothetical protein ACHQM5_007756 [Ranunculus cassubicifolius]
MRICQNWGEYTGKCLIMPFSGNWERSNRIFEEEETEIWRMVCKVELIWRCLEEVKEAKKMNAIHSLSSNWITSE